MGERQIQGVEGTVRIVKWVKSLFRRPKQKPKETLSRIPAAAVEQRKDEIRLEVRRRLQTPPPIPHREVGRFMKHGRQLPEYRKSVKARIQPEEEKKHE